MIVHTLTQFDCILMQIRCILFISMINLISDPHTHKSKDTHQCLCRHQDVTHQKCDHSNQAWHACSCRVLIPLRWTIPPVPSLSRVLLIPLLWTVPPPLSRVLLIPLLWTVTVLSRSYGDRRGPSPPQRPAFSPCISLTDPALFLSSDTQRALRGDTDVKMISSFKRFLSGFPFFLEKDYAKRQYSSWWW